MKYIEYIFLLSLTLVLNHCSKPGDSQMIATDLCCEYLTNPLGIDETQPRLSWKLQSDQENGNCVQQNMMAMQSMKW